MAEDIRENAMGGGTPARLRGLDANGNSISATLAEVTSEMPVATINKKGLASASQGIVSYTVNAGSSMTIELIHYGMYLFVSEQIDGTSLLFHISYYKNKFKILLDPFGIIGSNFRIEQPGDGIKRITVTNLISIPLEFSINRL